MSEEPSAEENLENFNENVQAFLDETVKGCGDMFVSKWVLTMEYIDASGERAIWLTDSENNAPWDVMGLLEYARNHFHTMIAPSVSGD